MSELAVVKVFSIVEGYPAVVVVERIFFERILERNKDIDWGN